MELTTALRLLWAHRLAVAAAALVSVVVGVLMMYHVSARLPPTFTSRDHPVGQGTAQVLIDTQQSQIASSALGTDPNGVYPRASELADLMATGPRQRAIAHRLGINPAALGVTPPPSSVALPIRATPLASAGQKLVSGKPPWQLSIVVDPVLPIIAFNTVAPTPADAGRLASTAVAVLQAQVRADVIADGVPVRQRLVVNVIGPPTTGILVQGPGKVRALMVALAVFFLMCVAIVIVTGRRRRVASAGRHATGLARRHDHQLRSGGLNDADYIFSVRLLPRATRRASATWPTRGAAERGPARAAEEQSGAMQERALPSASNGADDRRDRDGKPEVRVSAFGTVRRGREPDGE